MEDRKINTSKGEEIKRNESERGLEGYPVVSVCKRGVLGLLACADAINKL